jgi:hypothetical protein
MKQLEERHFQSDENKIFIRKSDNLKFGTDMYLALNDSIENYDEVDMTEEDKEWFRNLQEEHDRMFKEKEERFDSGYSNNKKQLEKHIH